MTIDLRICASSAPTATRRHPRIEEGTSGPRGIYPYESPGAEREAGIALKAMGPSGPCGFESHPGHQCDVSRHRAHVSRHILTVSPLRLVTPLWIEDEVSQKL